MSKAAAETDAVIIGLGAAGAIAAMVLTNAGLEVTGIEAGPFHADTAFMPDELGALRTETFWARSSTGNDPYGERDQAFPPRPLLPQSVR